VSRLKRDEEAPKEESCQVDGALPPGAVSLPANNEAAIPQNTEGREDLEIITKRYARKREERARLVWYLCGLGSQLSFALICACFVSLRTRTPQLAICISLLTSLVVDILVKLSYLSALRK
jgi:hypothetical protein